MVYNLDVKIEVTVGETHGMLGTLVGLDKHLQDEFSNEKSAQFIAESPDLGASTAENGTPKEFKMEPEPPG
jgi:hypothetical protein